MSLQPKREKLCDFLKGDEESLIEIAIEKLFCETLIKCTVLELNIYFHVDSILDFFFKFKVECILVHICLNYVLKRFLNYKYFMFQILLINFCITCIFLNNYLSYFVSVGIKSYERAQRCSPTVEFNITKHFSSIKLHHTPHTNPRQVRRQGFSTMSAKVAGLEILPKHKTRSNAASHPFSRLEHPRCCRWDGKWVMKTKQ